MNAPEKLPTSAATEQDKLAQALASRLRRHVQGQVFADRAGRGRYSTDASIYQVMPVAVLVPETETDVLMALEIAREMKVPVLPRGGGTSQCGQTVGAALVIDQSKHLNKITEFDATAHSVTVQPGIVLDHLNQQLAKRKLWFAVDVSTSAQATIGGMAGNNSCGSRSIAYGNMVHNVLGIEAVLSDGTEEFFGPFGAQATRPVRSARTGKLISSLFEIGHAHQALIEQHWPKVFRRVGGYNLDVFHNQNPWPYTQDGSVNLAHLLVGSEGTLAWFKRLQLKLHRLPTAKTLGVVNFASFHAAMDSAQHIVKLKPSAVELVDRTMIELSLHNPAFATVVRQVLVGKPDALLLVEFSGEDQAQQIAKLHELDQLIADLGFPGSVVQLVEPAAQKALWEVRKAGLNIMMSLRGDGKPVSFIEDCCVPLEHLAQYTAQLTQVFERHGTKGTWYAHASVGTLHVRPILDMRKDGAAKMRSIATEASELVRKYKGAFSGEHGDGLVRSEWVQWQYGPQLTQAMERVKDLFDPLNLMNPGKIVRSTKMDETQFFRFPPSYKTIPIQPALNWSSWDVQNDPQTEITTAPGTGGDNTKGFASAVHMCNNNGHCRKFDAGAMCPSYRVTKDEMHSTRGRANTLRLAVSGQLDPEQGLLTPAVKQALDLCVSCKACKRECPTGVDMARMKLEWNAAYKAQHGFSLRDKLIAHLPRYAPWAARFAPLLNLRNRSTLLATVVEKVTGFSAQRSLPQWQTKTVLNTDLSALLVSAQQALSAEHVKQHTSVVLLADTFNAAFDRQLVLDAVNVLRAAGYVVHIPGTKVDTPVGNARSERICCGRTYLSTGMISEARSRAQHLVRTLTPFVQAGVPIIGLEPSCLFTLKDEYPGLRLHEATQEGNHPVSSEQVEALAQHVMLFEQLLVHADHRARFATIFKPALRSVLLHGHCHQKAFGAVPAVLDALRLIPQASPQLIESSCCGMAGSFGVEAEHVQVSEQMAQLALWPAVQAAPQDAWIVADGTSCRHQIEHGTQRHALHVASVLAAHLNAPA